MGGTFQNGSPVVAQTFQRTYEIHEVAALTGLSTTRLRAWERRYSVVRPSRTANGYRAYTAAQVALLRAFARLVTEGERIGDLAAESPDTVVARAAARTIPGTPLEALLDAVRRVERDRLEGLVQRQLGLRGLAGFASEVVCPLAVAVGDEWALGRVSVAGEHMASEVVLQALKNAMQESHGEGPLVIAACLPGERHEWGVLSMLARVLDLGWRVQYFGADLPVPELVEAAWRLHPRIIAFSTSDPARCEAALPALSDAMTRLPEGAVAAIGGAGIEPHRRVLTTMGLQLGDSALFRLIQH